jgi:hypothetical protein
LDPAAQLQHSIGLAFVFFTDSSKDRDGELVDGEVFQLVADGQKLILSASAVPLKWAQSTEA